MQPLAQNVARQRSVKQTYHAAYSFYITFIKYDIYLDCIKKMLCKEKKKNL
jgi:hypothetical protein